MKVLFLADIHIKIGQKNVPNQWAKNRYQLFIEKIAQLQAKTDLVILGGDIFDKVPNIEELEVYFELIRVLTKPCFIISGNHESVKKSTTFLSNLKTVTKLINKNVEIIDDFYTYNGIIDFIPYNKLKDYYPQDIDFHSDILVTHVRGEIPPHVKPEVPLELFDRWKVVLAGDLHSYSNSQRNILYPGSPMSTSFHRSPIDNGVIILDTDTLKHEWVSLGLPQLLRKTVKVGEPMLATEYDHTIYEVEGDMSELASVEDNELVDKKINRRATNVTLMLDSSMSLVQELEEYLRYILQINNEQEISNILDSFNKISGQLDDNLQKTNLE
jgi:DNA repair exonuclease SbcCD nuclease subunit